MCKFIALPTGAGDSFYFEKEENDKVIKILVDGGKSKNKAHELLKKYCQSDELDILICTHNDTDHSNGIIGILENWKGKIKEIWLPASLNIGILIENSSIEPFEKEILKNISEVPEIYEYISNNIFKKNNEANTKKINLHDICDLYRKVHIKPEKLEKNIKFLQESIKYKREILSNKELNMFRESDLFKEIISAGKNIQLIFKKYKEKEKQQNEKIKLRLFKFNPKKITS